MKRAPNASSSPAAARRHSSPSVGSITTYMSAGDGEFPAAGYGLLRSGCRRGRRALRHVVDELEVDHLSRVAGPRADLDDPRVAAGAVGEAWRDLAEELVRDRLQAQERDGLAVGGEVAPLPERDHLLGDRTHLLRLRLGRLDAAVLE